MSLPAHVRPVASSHPPRGSADEKDRALSEAEVLLGLAWPTVPSDDSATRIYLCLVRTARPTRGALLAEGFAPAEIERALLLLQSRGLVELSSDDRIEVPPPELTLPRYAATLERQALTSRSAAQGLTQLYRMARTDGPDTLSTVGVGLLGSALEIERARWEVMTGARSSLLHVFAVGHHGGPATIALAAELAEAAGPDGPVARVPHRQAVFDAGVLDIDGALRVLASLSEVGVEVRIAPRVPCSAVVADQSALLDLSPVDPSGFGSMLIRHRPLVQVVRTVAEGIHESGTSVSRALAADEPRPWIDDRDRQILLLIAAGATDTMIARQVRISQRTVERRLRVIMDELGATTRFQAGVQAARRGLV